MRFNPLIVLWAYLGLDVLCGHRITSSSLIFRFTPSNLIQEMRFNPLIVLWAYLGLDVLCGRAIRATPPLLCALLLKLAVIVTFAVTNFSTPLPVQVGPPSLSYLFLSGSTPALSFLFIEQHRKKTPSFLCGPSLTTRGQKTA